MSIWSDFEDDAPKQCAFCEEDINPGDDYYIYAHRSFCSRECAGMFWSIDTRDIIKQHLYSKQDKEEGYGDLLYDRRRDEDGY